MNKLFTCILISASIFAQPKLSKKQVADFKLLISKISKKEFSDTKNLSQDFKELFVSYKLSDDDFAWKQCGVFYSDFENAISHEKYMIWRNCLDSTCNKDCISQKKLDLLSPFDKIIGDKK